MKLAKLVEAVEELQTETSLNIYFYGECVWSYCDQELSINTDSNEDDLLNGDGNNYSFYTRYQCLSEDGYVMFYDADNSCGTKDTIIVKHSQRVMWE